VARGVADTNGASDVFVLDRNTGQRDLVSISQDGSSTGNRASLNPIISPNGRMVAFYSESTNLVADARRRPHLYVRDLQTRTTKLVGPVPFFRPIASFSSDGARLVFVGNIPGYYDSRVGSQSLQVYVYDTISATVSFLTYDYTETRDSLQDTTSVAISPDGRKVAFRSLARNLTADSFSPGVFIRDLETGDLTRVPGPAFNSTTISPTVQFSDDGSSLLYGGGGTNLYSWSLSGGAAILLATNVAEANISGDGKSIALTRRVSVGSPRRDLFLSDTTSGTETLITSNIIIGAGAAVPFATGGIKPQISHDGRFVAFQTRAQLATNDTNTQTDVYLYHRDAGQLSVLSVNADGQAAGSSSRPIVTSNYVAFCSFATDIVPHDYNNGADIFLAALPATDSDSDGIDDQWELTNFNSLDADAAADTDADGMSNAAEFAAGTSPSDPQSRLYLKAISINEKAELVLKWAAVAGRAYKIQVRPRLIDGGWEDLTDAVSAASAEATISLPVTAPASELYLRVVLAE
jgi:Tol biopolymer transport system component